MPRKQWIPQNDLNTFVETLNRMDADDVDGVMSDLEDFNLSDIGDTDFHGAVKVSDFPDEVPKPVRDHLVELVRSYRALEKEFQGVCNMLYSEAGAVHARKERAEKVKLPKCKCCGAVLEPRSKR